jgi:succinyl-CoA:acetate CoA-transferase
MIYDRIHSAALRGKVMGAEDAASFIKDGMTIGTSGFTRIGYPKAVTMAVAANKSAKNLSLVSGASVGDELDGVLARAGLMARRYPFQTQADVRKGINSGVIAFNDTHVGQTADLIRRETLGKIDVAILECMLVDAGGCFVPTLSVGISDILARRAEKVILELNLVPSPELMWLHDIALVDQCEKIMTDPADRVGTPYIPLDRERVAAVVVTEIPDQNPAFAALDDTSRSIASHILEFLNREIKTGALPANFCMQSGVGAVANAVLDGFADSPFRDLSMYTEVIQDGAVRLIERGIITKASGTALSLSREMESRFYDNLSFFKEKVVLRPQEVTNHGSLIRRFGVIAINTAVEADIYGNINSTHVMGSDMINGIGGSNDFARNAKLAVFITPSTAKNGKISCIVPMVTHTDNTEHDVDIIITEQGMADLRDLSPKERAVKLINNCCHPSFRPALREYYDRACAATGNTHTPHDLKTAFSWHQRYMETGSML